MFTKQDMLEFVKWYDSKNEGDCHRTFEEELSEWLNISNRLEKLVSLGASQPMQTADIEKQEQLVTLLYEFADKQLYKEGNKITHKGFKETDEKFRDIYSVGEYLKKIMNLFGYKIISVQ